MALFGLKYLIPTAERVARVEEKVQAMDSDIQEIKESVKGIKKYIIIVTASSSLISNGNLSTLADIVGSKFQNTGSEIVKFASIKEQELD